MRAMNIKLASVCAVVLLRAICAANEPIGSMGQVGCLENPKRVNRLLIDAPATYENFMVDGEWAPSTIVKIVADDVILRNCEIHSGKHNAVVVAGRNVVIESCKIHHALAGTFHDQNDAHGITGQPDKLVIRNCEIGMVSGDAIQFDPGRRPWGDVLIENCTLWTGPLERDVPGFKHGERPGENAIDTKQLTTNPRSSMTIRNCLFRGWKQPGQIGNMAAVNLKNHVGVVIENCVFCENEICLRLRGGNGEYGGALVTVRRCAVYDSEVAVRIEDGIRDLKIRGLGIGSGVHRTLDLSGGGAGPGYEYEDEFEPLEFDAILRAGVLPKNVGALPKK